MKRKYLDLAERVVWTFIQTFLSTLLLDGAIGIDLPPDQKLKVAAGAAVISAVKCVIGFQIGNGDSASTAPTV